MSRFTAIRRRLDLWPPRSPGPERSADGGTGASSLSPCGRREPHGAAGTPDSAYLAIAEALQDGADVVPASHEVGRRLAEDGFSLPEALDGLCALYHAVAGGDPAFPAVRALSSSWAESSLVYLHSLSCEDPLTGLASLAHVRSKLGELYREADLHGTTVAATHALVVVEPVNRQGLSAVDRELQLVDVAECLRIVFCGGDVLGRLGPARAAALVGRDPGLPEQVETVKALITEWQFDSAAEHHNRVWIEGLPASVHWAGRVLDELART